MSRNVQQHARASIPLQKALWPRIAAAAAILILVASGWFYYHQRQISLTAFAQAAMIAPGKNAATLTLANGRRIVLSDAVNGQLAKEAGVIISKNAKGQIKYELKDQNNGQWGGMNTLSTARGETYQVQLPDGTLIWLNAESVIKYPSSFAKMKERRVALQGEAYFEVAKSYMEDRVNGKLAAKRLPFIVVANNQEVEVLGTHFNINSYADEASTKTTLLEGAVKVTSLSTHLSSLLKPNQQAILNHNIINVTEADVELATAWKNGFFQFEKASVETVLHQLSRWYDVDVTYQGKIRERNFTGNIYRNLNLAEALSLLKFTGVKFRVDGRHITVVNE